MLWKIWNARPSPTPKMQKAAILHDFQTALTVETNGIVYTKL
ncbi:hypothetical protein HMPREF9120_01603 [Neisseria sp. oral taxon 020 str. F0370]|nr:hypothetical protein HMPREF9120_01603 [Neisseria sp. oral taxon 020 str. F0370]